jgi:uncharacterized protein (TIGR02611 family)
MLRRPIARVRERMVLGQVRPLLEGDERVIVWAHVHAPEGDHPGLLSMTTQRCMVHWSPKDEATASFRWAELTAWEVSTATDDGVLMSLTAGRQELQMRLPLTTTSRAGKATRVVEHVARHAPRDAAATGPDLAGPLAAARRGWRGHARRVAVTVVGLLVVLLSVLFASPFVPGPGALTFLAGLAILAREYDWARDVHLWVKRKFDRLWNWLRERRERRRRVREDRRRRTEVRDLGEARARRAREGPGDRLGADPGLAPEAEARVQNE